MKILIADDSEFMRVLLKKIIESSWSDAAIHEAATGQQAIDACQADRPDVILMDIMMPDKTGLEALKEIGTDPPTLIISAAGQDNLIDEAKKLGARDFIVKPFEQQRVIQAIKIVLGEAGTTPPSEPNAT